MTRKNAFVLFFTFLFQILHQAICSSKIPFLPTKCDKLFGSSIIHLSTTASTAKSTTSIKYLRTKTFTQNEAVNIIDTILFPIDQYKKRLKIARDAQFSTGLGVDANSNESSSLNSNVMSASDPRLSFTYDEFPVQSMDQLLELAMEEYKKSHNGQKPKVLVDLGSGCGRLVLHAAICEEKNDSGNNNLMFDHIHGIEISKALHEIGVRALDIGAKEGYFTKCIQDDGTENEGAPSVSLHLGDANDLSNILHQADMVFTYSTVFDTKCFDERLGAMILSDEWSKMLASVCQKGCIVVTTDRALDPQHGWQLQCSLDVENPKLMGTTGYISKLQK